MLSKRFFSYIRVSTARQGQTGTSLVEQRAAIERHAQTWKLEIIREFEEQETAAKRGRPVFLSMLKELKAGRASGVIMHKIDRSARNLRDWAELGELIDKGIEVHFANENLDLYSRGGRLSADIQAVVAADYIRNLREEVKKGLYGRLKQGYYPMPAPIGYLNRGAGEAKAIDPVRGPLIKRAFEFYATGRYGIRALQKKMNELGLHTKSRQPISLNALNNLLKNPFYTGIIRLKTSGDLYEGRHPPLIGQPLFDTVQNVLRGKIAAAPVKQSRELLFRKLLLCGFCRHRLVGEIQKGHVYYRCHTEDCRQKTVREELINDSFVGVLERIKFRESEMMTFGTWYENTKQKTDIDAGKQKRSLELQLERTNARLSKLTDALVDDLVDEKIYLEKKNNFVLTIKDLKERMESATATDELAALRRTAEFLELVNSAHSRYVSTNYENKRELVQTVTSNFFVREKSVSIKLNLPFELVVNRRGATSGGALRDKPRTFEELFRNLLAHFKRQPTAVYKNNILY